MLSELAWKGGTSAHDGEAVVQSARRRSLPCGLPLCPRVFMPVDAQLHGVGEVTTELRTNGPKSSSTQ